MINSLSPLIASNTNALQTAPQGSAGGSFDQVLSTTASPLQQVPVVGTIYQAFVNHPLQILGAAARGFLVGGPLGAAAGAGLSLLSDQVSGDQTVVQRTEALLKAYGPLSTT